MTPLTERATTYRIVIPDWQPCRDNQLKGHWATGAALKKRDVRTIAKANLLAQVPLVAMPRDVVRDCRKLGISESSIGAQHEPRKRRVGLEVFFPRGGRRPDPTAFFKSLLDALCEVGLLVDDSEKWYETSQPVWSKGPKATVITLEDIG